jgi:hypothetical protein
MRNLPEVISHAQLVQEIVGQFTFMRMMAEPQDRNFQKLQALDLNDICNKADNFFVEFCEIEGLIMAHECKMDEKLAAFLKEWQSITDVTAIQQNIHYHFHAMDYVEKHEKLVTDKK